MSNKLPVLEIFGPTIQGEGSMIGVKTVFVRVAGCDYNCSWCDSKFTWDGTQKPTLMTQSEIMLQIDERVGVENYNHITISGGNPALYDFTELISYARDEGIKIGVETQGSIWKDWFRLVDDLTISPKPPSSRMQTDFLKLAEIMHKLRMQTVNKPTLKVVVFDDKDLDYAKYVHRHFNDIQMFLQVGNSDVSSADVDDLTVKLLEKLEWLADKVVADKELNDVRVLPQLHALLWGNKRGV